MLPGAPDARGLALVRRASDHAPAPRAHRALGPSRRRRDRRVDGRAAPTASLAAGAARPDRPRGSRRPRPTRATPCCSASRTSPSSSGSARWVCALADRGMLVVGRAGSGKSTALAHARRAGAGRGRDGRPRRRERPGTPSRTLSERMPEPGSLVLIDDLDALGATLPAGLRAGAPGPARTRGPRRGRGGDPGRRGVAQRLTGGAARIADLLPRRLVLAASSRAEHLAAGGDPAHYTPGRPPGRGRLDGRSRAGRDDAAARGTPPVCRSRPGIRTARSPASSCGARPPHAPHSPGWEREGARLLSLEEFDARAANGGRGQPVVVTGEADEWQRHWRALGAMRADHDLVVDAACAPEFRMLTGERSAAPVLRAGSRAGVAAARRGEPADAHHAAVAHP